jgi:hypothetical protein
MMYDTTRYEALFRQVEHELTQAADGAALLGLARRHPAILEAGFAALLDAHAAAAERAGGLDLAEGLRERARFLRQASDQVAAAAHSPMLAALLAFLYAPDETAARRIFAVERRDLDSAVAQRILEEELDPADPESLELIEERARLLRRLRGV